MLNQALFFLKFRPRSEFEVRRYLAKKGATAAQTDQTIAQLKQLKFLDDAALVKFWLRRREASPRAVWMIKAELKQLGVDQALVDRVMGDPKRRNQQLARRLIRKLAGKPPEKIMAALSRRGFDWDTIKGLKSLVMRRKSYVFPSATAAAALRARGGAR